VAVRLDAGVVGDVVDVRPSTGGPVAVHAAPGESCLVESRVVRGVPIFTVRTEAVTPEPVTVPAPVRPAVRRAQLAWPAGTRAARRVRSEPGPAGERPPLAGAAVVVAGGHGVGSRASFELVAQVADALGGAVGGSHTATELGWCPRSAQVDQTGTIVHPRLYVALGISGSVRHRAGMRHAATVVAVDRDPAAPIFGVADLGVVGDLHEVVPALLTEIRRRQALPAPIPATARRPS
jgi:electron transfer flavoprotein alpha subunit